MIEYLANFLGGVVRDVALDLGLDGTVARYARSGLTLEITPTYPTGAGGWGWEAKLVYATRGYVGSERIGART